MVNISIPIWAVIAILGVVLLVAFPFVTIPIIVLVAGTFVFLRWQVHRERSKRERAIERAVEALPPDERVEYVNHRGRYSDPSAIPSNLPLDFMTKPERQRYYNRIGEFAEAEG